MKLLTRLGLLRAAFDPNPFKMLRKAIAGEAEIASKHAAGLALDILEANGQGEIVLADRHGHPVRVATRDKVIAASLIQQGEYGYALMQRLAETLHANGLRPADLLLVDVGANIGTTCLNAYVAGFRRFLAFEPDALNFALLSRNVAGLADAEVTLLNVAAGAAGETRTFYRHARNLGSHTFVPPLGWHRGEASEIRIERLADRLPPATPFVLLIDTEGFEPAVIAGAQTEIMSDCRAIALELTPDRYTPADVAYLSATLARFAESLLHVQEGRSYAIERLGDLVGTPRQPQFDAILVNRKWASTRRIDAPRSGP
jgi:FkbM family methyltransferase